MQVGPTAHGAKCPIWDNSLCLKPASIDAAVHSPPLPSAAACRPREIRQEPDSLLDQSGLSIQNEIQLALPSCRPNGMIPPHSLRLAHRNGARIDQDSRRKSGRLPVSRKSCGMASQPTSPVSGLKQWDRGCPFLCNFSIILYQVFFKFADEIT